MRNEQKQEDPKLSLPYYLITKFRVSKQLKKLCFYNDEASVPMSSSGVQSLQCHPPEPELVEMT